MQHVIHNCTLEHALSFENTLHLSSSSVAFAIALITPWY